MRLQGTTHPLVGVMLCVGADYGSAQAAEPYRALRDLREAADALAGGAEEATLVWLDPSMGWRFDWRLARREQLVQIVIVRSERPSKPILGPPYWEVSDEPYQPVGQFSVECDLTDLQWQLAQQSQRLRFPRA
jgi:hypothetical protein